MAHLPSDIGVIWKLLSPGSGLVGFTLWLQKAVATTS